MLAGSRASEITSKNRTLTGNTINTSPMQGEKNGEVPVWTMHLPPRMMLLAPVITALRETLSCQVRIQGVDSRSSGHTTGVSLWWFMSVMAGLAG